MNRVKFNYKLTKKSPKKSTHKKKQQCSEEDDDYYKDEQVLDLNDDEDYTVNEYYLYNDISMKSIQGLLKFIKNGEKRWKLFLLETSDIIENATPKPLKIFINSNGGDVFAAIPLIDAISNSSIPIHTFIEGIAASAASLISMMGH